MILLAQLFIFSKFSMASHKENLEAKGLLYARQDDLDDETPSRRTSKHRFSVVLQLLLTSSCSILGFWLGRLSLQQHAHMDGLEHYCS